MAKQPQINQDDLREIAFPYAGLSLVQPAYLKGQPGTCEIADNVVFFDPSTGRGRGAARSGLSKWIPEQVSGDHEIQHIGAIVTVSGEMIDWSFDGPEQRFPGIYIGIGFIDIDFPFLRFERITFPSGETSRDDGWPGSATFSEASGYPPKKSKNEKIVVTLTSADYEVEINTNVQLTGILRDRNGGFLSAATLDGKNIFLRTDPPGKQGDGDFGSAGGSEMTPFVQNDEEGVVYYKMEVKSVLGNIVATSNRIRIKYIETPSSPPFLDETQGESTSSPAASLGATFFFNPPSGALVLIFVATDTAGVTSNAVTDSQGNTYTHVLSLTGDPPLKLWVYRAKTAVSAALTVTVTPNTSSNISLTASTILDADPLFPVGGTASNSGTATNTANSATTTSIPVITPLSLVFGFFAQNSGTGTSLLVTSGTGMGGVDNSTYGAGGSGTGSAAVHTSSASVSVNTAVTCSNAIVASCAYQAIGISIRG